ncbi:uncharacterized protein NECHADRAFT_101142 [Fusarium vanettenii 77-13-4]|uniref:Expressed protein n=1 Tax=Fusarium vanettenii (strain ATCC MYA-4622 / CBS 123669 / FGSC 9596 / NRRL 45880 / 77-13-4) TaxID=660122 RepID=C7ZAZ9_FUSV7|nr:uncharacterized protein NECHADRAFT_101142 [Fusarium vanettenii 77-13-4]EEU38810.1 expressed protein [Fusarium vanettenii 77-13-4]
MMTMASIIPPSRPSAPCTLLSMPLEIRQHIFRLCTPQNLCFNCSWPFDSQNRPDDWRNAVALDDDAGIVESWDSSSSDPEEDTDSEPPYEPCGLDDYCHESQRHRPQGLTSGPSAFPGLLLVCRQITDEVTPMLYGGNTFIFNDQHDARFDTLFGLGLGAEKRIRKMILVLRPSGTTQGSPLDSDIWDKILSNVLILGIIVPMWGPGYRDEFGAIYSSEGMGKWTAWLTSILQYLDRALPKTTKVVVDTNKEETTDQLVKKEMFGRCVFQRLRAGDSIFRRGEFAIKTRRSDESDHDDYDYDDYPTSCRDIIDDCDYCLYYSD